MMHDPLLGPLGEPWAACDRFRWLGAISARSESHAEVAFEDALTPIAASARIAPSRTLREMLDGQPPPVWWTSVRRLVPSDAGLDTRGLLKLLDAVDVSHITHLDLDAPSLDGRALVAATRAMPALETLFVSRLDWDGFDASAVSGGVSTLALNAPPEAPLSRLLASALGESLRWLSVRPRSGGVERWWTGMGSLSGLAIHGGVGVAELLADGLPASLEALTVAGASGPDVGRQVARAVRSALGALNLSRTPLSRDDARALGDTPWFGDLHELRLSHTRLDRASARALAEKASTVRALELAHTPVEVRSLRDLPSLVSLDVSHSPHIDDGLATVVTQNPDLEVLIASGCALTDEGLKAMPSQSSIARLLVDRTSVTGRGLSHVLSGHFPSIATLDASGCTLGEVPSPGSDRCASLEHLWLEDIRCHPLQPHEFFDPERMPALVSLRWGDRLATRSIAEGLARLGSRCPIRELRLGASIYWAGSDLAEIVSQASSTLVRLQITDWGGGEAAFFDALATAETPALSEVDLRTVPTSTRAVAALLSDEAPARPWLHRLWLGPASMDAVRAVARSSRLGALDEIIITPGESLDVDAAQDHLAHAPHARPESYLGIE